MSSADVLLIAQLLTTLLTKAQAAAALLAKPELTEEDVDASGLRADLEIQKQLSHIGENPMDPQDASFVKSDT